MFKKSLASLKNSLRGLKAAFLSDRSVKAEIVCAVILSLALLRIDVGSWRKLAMELSLLFVLCVELLNTAIEKLADRLTGEYDPKIKFVKDAASAAVLIAIIIAIAVWVFCLAPE